MLETVWSVLEDAGYSERTISQQPVGVFVGMTTNTYSFLSTDNDDDKDSYSLDASSFSLPNRISYTFNLTGPSLAIDTACSSSLVAIHLACESIKRNECQMAIASGVNLYLHPSKYQRLCQNRVLSTKSPNGLFAQNGDGFIPGEGVGAVLLKSLSQAINDGDFIYGVIRGSATTHKGKNAGFPLPSPPSQSALIKRVIESAGIEPENIRHIEMQALGSEMVDIGEWRSLVKTFQSFTDQKEFCSLGSVKPNIGHLEAASGIAQLTKGLLQIQHGQCAPTLLAESIHQEIDCKNTPFHIQTGLTKINSRKVKEEASSHCFGVSSFGAGGTNAHLIVEAFPFSKRISQKRNTCTEQECLVILSAPTEIQLSEMRRKLVEWISDSALPQTDLYTIESIAYTLQVGRNIFEERWGTIVKSKEALLEALNEQENVSGETFSSFKGQVNKKEGNKKAPTDLLKSIYKNRNWREACKLWMQGYTIDWENFWEKDKPLKVPLPSYPFEWKRYWVFQSKKKMNKKK